VNRLLLLFLFVASHALAVSVRDDAGRTVTLPQPAKRIIATAPHITELLFAAGGQGKIVGVTGYSDYPAAARAIPQVGDVRQLDIERVLALKPDLLVVWKGGNPERQIEQLQRLGIPVYYSDPHDLKDIPAGILSLGKLLGTESVAQKNASELSRKLHKLSAQYGKRPVVRVFYQVSERPLYTLNGRHIVSDAIRVCGGRNVFSDMKVTAPNISLESVLKENPEIIFNSSVEEGKSGLDLWRRYATLEAVRRGNLFDINPDLLDRAGPRMIDGTAVLCEKMEQARQNRRKR